VDVNQNPTTPGSFDINHLYAASNDSAHLDSCRLLVGV
jgi:hypothetical protein